MKSHSPDSYLYGFVVVVTEAAGRRSHDSHMTVT